MLFKDIVEQRNIINRLTEIIDSGRISHAQMILGPTKAGSLQMALAYVQYLSCTNRQHFSEGDLRADSCGTCPSCKKIEGLMHPDLHLYFPSAATASIKSSFWCGDFMTEFQDFLKTNKGLGTLDDWYAHLGIENKQGLIRESDAAHIVADLSMKSYEGGWKMMIIWMAEKMNKEAANELLKTLEEPSSKTIIILVTESEEKMLSTIRSRVQSVRLTAVEVPSETAAEMYGGMLVEWLRLLFKLKMQALSAQVDKIASLGREQQKQFLTYALNVMRQCFLHNAAGQPVDLHSGDAKFDAMFPNMITVNNVELVEKALEDALRAVERNAHGKINFMQLSFNMSRALKKK